MYIFIIGNQLTTQNNDKYCPETLTGTAFSIKNMLKSQHGKLQPNRQQQLSVCQCVTASDYHKVGMSVKGRLVGTTEPIFIHPFKIGHDSFSSPKLKRKFGTLFNLLRKKLVLHG